MAKGRTPSSKPLAATLIVIGIALVGGLAAFVRYSGADRVPENLRNPNPRGEASTERTEATPAPRVEVIVFSPEFVGEELRFKSAKRPVPKGTDPHVFAVDEYLAGLSFVPKTARVKQFAVKDGAATLDLDPSIQAGYGSDDEIVVVGGMLTALGQFPDVKTVLFLVDGQPLDSLGNIDLTTPRPVRRPGATPERTSPNAGE